MIRQKYLDISNIIKDPKVFRLFKIVADYGGVLRLVGGCVRDAIIGIEDSDIDLATDLTPDELVEACLENGIKTVPIGIKYGTVGVVINDNILEVTSLREDVTTNGRHPVIEFTSDWRTDASRRDLTINAVYADEKGNVFDYYNGISDLENGIVKFIGKPEVRIKEDFLRILRFFRFYSMFSKGTMDRESFIACCKNKEGLRNVSIERIQIELRKILLTPKAVETLKIMFENNILGFFISVPETFENLNFLIDWFDDSKIENADLRRLFLLYNPNEKLAEHISNVLKFSKKTRQHLINLTKLTIDFDDFLNDKKLNKIIYKYGKKFCIDKMIIMASLKKQKIKFIEKKIKDIQDLELTPFSIGGKDIIPLGFKGTEIGKTLELIEKIWIENNFTQSNDELLAIAKSLR